jgi:hypothetical protein
VLPGKKHKQTNMNPHKIVIPQPCSENWNTMRPEEGGKYCDSCQKTVIDFTKQSDEEIMNYFLQYQSQPTCGRFRTSQVAETASTPKLHKRLIYLQNRIESAIAGKWLKASCLFCLGLIMLLAGCRSRTTGEISAKASTEVDIEERQVTGKVAKKPSEIEECTDTVMKDPTAGLFVVGEIAPVDTVANQNQ